MHKFYLYVSLIFFLNNTTLANNNETNFDKTYEFYTKIIKVGALASNTRFSVDERWFNIYSFKKNKLVEIKLITQHQKVIFVDPKFKKIKKKKFTIKSNLKLLSRPDLSLRYSFRGEIIDGNIIIGKLSIIYMGEGATGSILINSITF